MHPLQSLILSALTCIAFIGIAIMDLVIIAEFLEKADDCVCSGDHGYQLCRGAGLDIGQQPADFQQRSFLVFLAAADAAVDLI